MWRWRWRWRCVEVCGGVCVEVWRCVCVCGGVEVWWCGGVSGLLLLFVLPSIRFRAPVFEVYVLEAYYQCRHRRPKNRPRTRAKGRGVFIILMECGANKLWDTSLLALLCLLLNLIGVQCPQTPFLPGSWGYSGEHGEEALANAPFLSFLSGGGMRYLWRHRFASNH